MKITHRSPYSDDVYTLVPRWSKYGNGRIALQLYSVEDGQPYATASINLPEQDIKPDEVAIKDYSENEGILDAIVIAGLVETPHRFVRSGMVRIPVCRIIG